MIERLGSIAARAILASLAMLLGAVAADASTLGGPLTLSDEGSFFVNGKVVPTNTTPPGHVTIDQMYVHYWIPAKVSGPPVIMVHGAAHTGITYETTPDGREGWATYFVRKGYPVYVVDQPGQGRSGFNTAAIAKAKADANAAEIPNIPPNTREGNWVNVLFGPAFGTAWPDEQFPLQAEDEYQSGLVPNANATLENGDTTVIDALTALVDKIGPAVLMVHSQSGSFGMQVVRRRPALVRAIVSLEGSCTPMTPADAQGPFHNVPFLSLFGDHTEGAVGFNGDARRNGCIQSVATIKAAGGPATFVLLPAIGIKGNSHMLMMDKNNLQIADIVMTWLAGPK